jgi:N-methylhydantoinase B
MIAQAAHIPVHLGSMTTAVQSAIRHFTAKQESRERSHKVEINPGDMIILNDPYQGGTHLPDITLISPVFVPKGMMDSSGKGETVASLLGYVASRAHHADVGGISPGSMPVATEIYQEGLIIPPLKLISSGELDQSVWDLILANVRTPAERSGDLHAQIGSNRRGEVRLLEMVERYGFDQVSKYMAALLEYTERSMCKTLRDLPDGVYRFTDYLDDDGVQADPVEIKVAVRIIGDRAIVDFTGSSPQRQGGVNAVYAITLSAVFYVFRCLLDEEIPNNSGCMAPIEVIAPQGSVVAAKPPAAVAGGNVETSQRIVDVLLGALAQAAPEKIPAASQGTMNNLTIGGWDKRTDLPFTYYETIGGGVGARPDSDGPSGLHSHMTNTLNTPVEALEYAYPLQVVRYEIRRGSGGYGRFRGGDGLIREILLSTPAQVNLLTERRKFPPYGLFGGSPGSCGRNLLIRNGREFPLDAKGANDLHQGDILRIETPGGGGYGK